MKSLSRLSCHGFQLEFEMSVAFFNSFDDLRVRPRRRFVTAQGVNVAPSSVRMEQDDVRVHPQRFPPPPREISPGGSASSNRRPSDGAQLR